MAVRLSPSLCPVHSQVRDRDSFNSITAQALAVLAQLVPFLCPPLARCPCAGKPCQVLCRVPRGAQRYLTPRDRGLLRHPPPPFECLTPLLPAPGDLLVGDAQDGAVPGSLSAHRLPRSPWWGRR